MSSDENEPLQSLIAEIVEAEDRGQPLDRAALLAAHPELADSLHEFFVDHDRMKSVAEVDPPTLPPQSSALGGKDPTMAPGSTLGEDATLPPTLSASQKDEALAVGDNVRYFGDYELLEEIARGGMGVVYKARQMNLNRTVALKMILSGEVAGEGEIKRFKSEAEAAAQLDHPGIVPIFEIGEHQGQHYFSMGYVEGGSLGDRLRDGPLPANEAAQLMVKICEAVAYAHEKGVIHRDLKPGNVLIDAGETPKVTDFGLAKHVTGDSELTKTGQVIGTPAYMPPEQASGKNEHVSALSDVYALGAMFYCMLTGRPPFQAATPMDTLLQVLDQEPVAPCNLNALVPPDLQTICLKCIEKTPGRRYQTAREVGEEFQKFLAQKPIAARPAGRLERTGKWIRRHPASAGLMAVGSLAIVTFLSTISWSNLRYRTLLQREQRITYGNQIALTDSALQAADLRRASELLKDTSPEYRSWEWQYLSRLTDGDTITIPTKTPHPFAFDDQRQHVATQTVGELGGDLSILNTMTGKPHRVLGPHRPGIGSFAVASNGSVAVTATNHVVPDGGGSEVLAWNSEVLTWNVDDETVIRVRKFDERVKEVFVSPDGRYVAAVMGIQLPHRALVWDVATGRDLFEFETDAATMAFTPDSRSVAVIALEVIAEKDLKRGRITRFGLSDVKYRKHFVRKGLPAGATLNEFSPGKAFEFHVRGVAFSLDGSLIAATDHDGRLYLWLTETSENALRIDDADARWVTFSPDGQLIATSGSDADGILSVKIWRVDSGELVRKIMGAGGNVAFTVDNQHVATGGTGGARLWSVDETPRHASFGNTESRESGVRFAISHDGQKIVMIGASSNVVEKSDDGRRVSSYTTPAITFWNVDGTKDKREILLRKSKDARAPYSARYHPNVIRDVAFLPSGDRFVTVSSYNGDEHDPPCELIVWNAEEMDVEWSVTRPSADRFWALDVSRDGATIVIGGYSKKVEIVDARTGEQVSSIPTRGTTLAMSPDGNTIATASGGWSEGLGEVRIWSLKRGRLQRLLRTSQMVEDLAFSPDGRSLAVANVDGVTVFDVRTAERIFETKGETFSVNCITFTRDSSRIVIGGDDLRVWDLNTGKPILTLHRHGAEIQQVGFTPDGRKLLSVDVRSEGRIWPR